MTPFVPPGEGEGLLMDLCSVSRIGLCLFIFSLHSEKERNIPGSLNTAKSKMGRETFPAFSRDPPGGPSDPPVLPYVP